MDLMLDNQFLMFISISFLGKMAILKTMMTFMMRYDIGNICVIV
jgi:hypothetical protein